MTLVPFPSRPTVQARLTDPACDIELTNGERTRRYHIRNENDLWYCQVWFGRQTQHRGAIADFITAQRTFAEYHREISELLLDGWLVTKGRYREDLLEAGRQRT